MLFSERDINIINTVPSHLLPAKLPVDALGATGSSYPLICLTKRVLEIPL